MCYRTSSRPRVSEMEKGVKEKKYGVLLDGLTHIQAHLHAVPGVMRQRLGQTRHAVVAVPQDLDPHALVLLYDEAVRREKKKNKKQKSRVRNVEIPFGTLNCFIDNTLAGALPLTSHTQSQSHPQGLPPTPSRKKQTPTHT